MTNYVRTIRNTIVRNEAIIDVEGIGNVHFTRPCMYHMGVSVWHVEAWFNVEGRDYWCTVWNDGDTELQTRAKASRAWFNAPIRRLPETAKRAWREAIAKAGLRLIREAKQLRCAFIDAGDTANAERVAMGNEAKVAVDTLPPLFDESVSNDVLHSPSMAGRETAQPMGGNFGEAFPSEVSSALVAWERAKRLGDETGIIHSGNVLAELLAGRDR